MPKQNQLTVYGINKISLKHERDPNEGDSKRTVSLKIELTGSEAKVLEEMMSVTASWSLTLSSVARQIPMVDFKDGESEGVDTVVIPETGEIIEPAPGKIEELAKSLD